jgi:hypothetical protein
MNGKIIAGASVGLVIGLVFGVLIGSFLFPNALNPTGAGTNNQVQVSGTTQILQTGTIKFIETGYGTSLIKTTAPIRDGKYSILVVGGKSYTVYVEREEGTIAGDYSLYVPEGVATFTADF